MKKIISILLAALMIFSLATVVFAGSYTEEAANTDVLEKCEACAGCTGKFGCNCCEACPGYINGDGVATNLAGYSICHYGSYYDVDVYEYDENGAVIKNADGSFALKHEGDYTMHYYWKAKCCEDCTGKLGCKCNNQDLKENCGCPACFYQPDHTEEQIQEGLQKGREGYTSGIQTALIAIRDVMYELFNKLFEFLRIDVILGADRVPSVTV